MPREKGNVCTKMYDQTENLFASQRVYVCYTTHAVVLIGTDVVLNCLKYALFFVTMLHGSIIDI